LALPGYGVLFFWKLGVLEHLRAVGLLPSPQQQQQQLPGGPSMWGSSAGGLAGVLAASGVTAETALSRAAALADEFGIARRPLGLAGVWGALVRRWLDELLPDDVAERCNACGVRVAVTQVPSFKTAALGEFTDKADVVDACLASCHIPFFMDGRPWAACRGGLRCVDGSLLFILLGRTDGLVPPPPPPPRSRDSGGDSSKSSSGHESGSISLSSSPSAVVVLDPWRDTGLRRAWSWRACLELLSAAGARRLVGLGRDYAKRLDAAGGFDALRAHSQARRREGERLPFELPLVP
jgi:hypothetical protein